MGMSVKHYDKSGKEFKGKYHKMPNGSLHSGATHTSSSKPLFHYGDLSNQAKRRARKQWK